jgi:hypothetical protein
MNLKLTEMRKIFVLAMIIAIIAGCKKDPPGLYEGLMAEYGVKGLDKIGNVQDGVDTSQIFFQGFMSGKIWIGGYEKETKKQIFNYTFPEPPIKEITVHTGYGQYETVSIDYYYVPSVFNDGNNTVAAVNGSGYALSAACYSELCFFNGNTLTAKHLMEYATISGIIPWAYNTVMIHRDVYSLSGDSLFQVNQNILSSQALDKELAINVNELIHIDYPPRRSISRLDLITGETVWYADYKLDIPSNARIDNRTINKNGNEWTITWNYTEYNGIKRTLSIKINIDTGEVLST